MQQLYHMRNIYHLTNLRVPLRWFDLLLKIEETLLDKKKMLGSWNFLLVSSTFSFFDIFFFFQKGLFPKVVKTLDCVIKG